MPGTKRCSSHALPLRSKCVSRLLQAYEVRKLSTKLMKPACSAPPRHAHNLGEVLVEGVRGRKGHAYDCGICVYNHLHKLSDGMRWKTFPGKKGFASHKHLAGGANLLPASLTRETCQASLTNTLSGGCSPEMVILRGAEASRAASERLV
eukprot:scaffold52010_cov16-Tisochrysis_lutea.AAC.1